MLSDCRRGAATEVHTISGAIVRAGAAATPPVPTPINSLLLALVSAVETELSPQTRSSSATHAGGDAGADALSRRAATARRAFGAGIAGKDAGLAAELVAAGLAALSESASCTIAAPSTQP